jgi:hypothetical protein
MLEGHRLFLMYVDKRGCEQHIFTCPADFESQDLLLLEGKELVWLTEPELVSGLTLAFEFEEVLKMFFSSIRGGDSAMFDIPKDKNFPGDAVQCHGCGGWGCVACNDRGWLPHDHPKGRRCERPGCANLIPPAQVAIYCSNECARADA